MTAALILVILGFCGLAIDLSRVYNRKVELQTAADTIAIAAARELDGTSAGVTRAVAAAVQAVNDTNYNYNNSSSPTWSDSVIRFGATPYGSTWLDSGAAAQAANAGNMFYVKVDTSVLDASVGDVGMLLLGVLPSFAASAHVNSVATAGRASTNVLPLAICAMSTTPGQARGTELVEYGFRRGVSYDLMQLNPTDNTSGLTYLVNPVALPGTTNASLMGRMDVVQPFVCTGTVAVPSMAGGRIMVETGFPLGSVYQQLNSRFGSTTPPCLSTSAPPDTNVKEFDFSTAFPWMNYSPGSQSAMTIQTPFSNGTITTKELLTVADLPTTDQVPGTPPPTAGVYGPLWIYAKAVVKDYKYVSGTPEPTGGYTPFAPTDWPTLYKPAPLNALGAQKIKSGYTYPSTPYSSITLAPPNGLKGVANRRVLNVPLLSCPVSGVTPATAQVLAVAKFFMTVQATGTHLYAEFAGLAPPTSLVGQVELYP